jgi:hypothetical protein
MHILQTSWTLRETKNKNRRLQSRGLRVSGVGNPTMIKTTPNTTVSPSRCQFCHALSPVHCPCDVSVTYALSSRQFVYCPWDNKHVSVTLVASCSVYVTMPLENRMISNESKSLAFIVIIETESCTLWAYKFKLCFNFFLSSTLWASMSFLCSLNETLIEKSIHSLVLANATCPLFHYLRNRVVTPWAYGSNYVSVGEIEFVTIVLLF